MDRIKFSINGVEHTVGKEVSSDLTLLDYIREKAELRGTKYMCRQAGCGACMVSVARTPDDTPVAVNSCIVSVTSCKDWDITTIEKVGNRRDGYHPLQKVLTKYAGTQCGHCTPGWIMSMFSLLQNEKKPTMLDIERTLTSNICRCTGYRPILEAFKTFAKDANDDIPDIEDLTTCKNNNVCVEKHNCEYNDWCFLSLDNTNDVIEIELKDNKTWYKVSDVNEIFCILENKGYDSYMLVSGNTAKGAYPINEYPRLLIDISTVPSLKGYTVDQNLVLNSGNTLTETLEIFKNIANNDDFRYLSTLFDHIQLIGHIAIRNLGSIAGNLMIKHSHNEFPSDVFLLLETIGAYLTICDSKKSQTMSMQQFLKEDMTGRVIINVLLPPLQAEYKIVTYKIMPRSRNVHAIVNSGFLIKMKNDVVTDVRIVYGGLSSNFIRATQTEKLLLGKNIFTNATLQLALTNLKSELIVDENPPEMSAQYRKQLALSLFYKAMLSLCPANVVNPRYRSGIKRLHESRPVSTAKQTFDIDKSVWPLNKPTPKLESLIQCSGEVVYTDDLPSFSHEIFGAFVLSTVALGTISSIDPSYALELPGVLKCFTAEDIPGVNTFTPAGVPNIFVDEEVLCSGTIKYFNQPIAIVVAETHQIAEKAAKMVKVTYKNIKKPVINIREAKKDSKRTTLVKSIDAKEKGDNVVKVIKNSNLIKWQYHFTMENLVCVVTPVEDNLKVHATSQDLNSMQIAISRALKINQNRIDVIGHLVGGAYGLKVLRENQVAVACSLVAKLLNRPCRFLQSLSTTMRSVGKRFPCTSDFEVKVSSTGKIQYLNYELYDDNGYTINEAVAEITPFMYSLCYDSSTWDYKVYNVTTDTHKNTWCRAPGAVEAISMTELIMEQISYEMSIDALQVRINNFDKEKSKDLLQMVSTLKENANYEERRASVNKFNKDNKWKKRGIRFSMLRWSSDFTQYIAVNVSVYYGDGSVTITHGGTELGQGINTKAAQICSYLLNLPLEKIRVKRPNTFTTPNSTETVASVTSQSVGVAIERCCQDLLSKLKPVKDLLGNPSWEELVAKAYSMNVDLQAHGLVTKDDRQDSIIVYGVTLAEVEVDILTGEFEIIRVDLLQDCGQSVNQLVDVGQIEGAFMMGLGYWTSEDVVFNQNTGELLTDRTWNYYVPLATDIPQDLRIYLRKNSYSTRKMFGAKCTGEPSVCMSIVVPFAIREAVSAARLEVGIPTQNWFQIDGPYTLEKICLSCKLNLCDFKYY